MTRYKKANENIYAPGEAKEKAARPAGTGGLFLPRATFCPGTGYSL